MKPIHPLFEPRFYSLDHELLRELGFDPNRELESHELNVLGTYEHHYDGKAEVAYRVVIGVTPLPAMFWQFDVEPVTTDGKAVRVTTGSGALSDYWPSVKLLAEGMLNVRPLGEVDE